MTPSTREILSIVSFVVRAVDKGRHADAALASILRDKTDLDRAEHPSAHRATMALWRWWGWVEPHGRQSIARAVALALLLQQEGEPDSLIREIAFAGRLDLTRAGAPPGALPLAARAAWLAKAAGGDAPDPLHLFPDWLPRHLPKMEDSAREALLASLQGLPALWVRAQGKEAAGLAEALRAAGFEVRPHATLDRAIQVLSGGDLYRTELIRAGRFEVQDVASQAVARATEAARGERWWDACAGAGGKALALADQMAGGGTILATDTRNKRLTELARRARRGGFSNIQPLAWEGKALPAAAKRAGFDGVLIDAPCSASATWRRNPDARWTVTEAAVRRLAALGTSLLMLASGAVRPGGRLVFATCALTRTENEEVVEAFLAAKPEFALDPVAQPLTGQATSGLFRVLPEETGGDGMFFARMRRATAKGEERGAKGEERGAKGEERGAKGEERGAKGEERGAKGEERGAKGEERGANGEG